METEVSNLQTSNLTNIVQNFSVSPQILRESLGKNTPWINAMWPTWNGYYKTVPILKKPVDFHAMWTVGKGWTADPKTTVILNHINGWGKDTFAQIMWQMVVIMKINGDSYAEIIRDPKTNMLINLKPLNPLNIRHIIDEKGCISEYQYWSIANIENKNEKDKYQFSFDPKDIFHLCNDRVGNEIHGVSIVESCKWVIDAYEEAKADWRRILHRSTIRVMYIDHDNISKLQEVASQYAAAIQNGELLILPALPKDVALQDYTAPPIDAFMQWINYLESIIFQALGIPKVLLGDSQQFTEASAQTSYLTYETPYKSQQKFIEDNIWNQLYLKVEFDEGASIAPQMQSNANANTGQQGFQPNQMQQTQQTQGVNNRNQ